METSLLKTQRMLQDEGILISFSGRFSHGIIVELGEAVKYYMEAEQRPKSDIYNVFAVFIELSQNIKKYASSKEGAGKFERIANSGIANIGKLDDSYFIWAGNLVEGEDVSALKEKLDLLLALDKQGLKKLYKEQLRKDISLEAAGAGMGLIDIARKASIPLEYSINEVDDNFSFYEILVTV